jgi:hypothetical protein
MGVGGQCHTPAALPPGKTRYQLCREVGGPRASLEGCGISRPTSGFDPRPVQPVASRYTDYASSVSNRYVFKTKKTFWGYQPQDKSQFPHKFQYR